MANSTVPLNNKVKCAFQSWGQELVAERFHQGALIINSYIPATVWMPSTDTVTIRWIDNSGNIHIKSSTENQVSFSWGNESGNDYTLTRNSDRLTVTTNGNATMLLMYDSY
jgi:hypothetical protein